MTGRSLLLRNACPTVQLTQGILPPIGEIPQRCGGIAQQLGDGWGVRTYPGDPRAFPGRAASVAVGSPAPSVLALGLSALRHQPTFGRSACGTGRPAPGGRDEGGGDPGLEDPAGLGTVASLRATRCADHSNTGTEHGQQASTSRLVEARTPGDVEGHLDPGVRRVGVLPSGSPGSTEAPLEFVVGDHPTSLPSSGDLRVGRGEIGHERAHPMADVWPIGHGGWPGRSLP